MRFFKLEDKDAALSSLNGNKLCYEFLGTALTDRINDLRKRIEDALALRNWKIPGVFVEFIYDIDADTNKHTLRVSRIKTDPKLCADVTFNSWSIRVRGMEMSLHEDNSGSLEVYCGNDWDKDRNEFVNGKRFHRKMDGKSRIVLQYDFRGSRFNATDDIGRGHFPCGNEFEPLTYNLSTVERQMLEGLNDVVDYIESHPVQDMDQFLFAEPNPTYLTNTLFAGSRFTSTVSRDTAYRINNREYKGNYGTDGGWRLLDLSVSPPKNHPHANLMNDGFIYCGIEWGDGKVDNHNWHYDSDKVPVVINLNKVDNVFVVDQSAAERFKDNWFKDNPGEGRLSNEAYHQMQIERASTMVHINEYKGGFEKPVVVICRVLSKDEIVLEKQKV